MIYLEFEKLTDDGKSCKLYTKIINRNKSPTFLDSASRIWEQDDVTKEVTLLKNRYGHMDDPVDMKEFLLIKLKAHG
jgi:hypothetical protein